jgi:hypothetical protein
VRIELSASKLFQGKAIPLGTSLIGTSALVQALDIEVPLAKPTCVSDKRIKAITQETADWYIFDNKYAVEGTVQAHLTFSLKHENLDLLVLKQIFRALPKQEITTFIETKPAASAVRRIWFLYEFLIKEKLAVPDAGKLANIDLINSKQYFAASGKISKRHRIRNNLLGTADFCPIVRRTKLLEDYASKDLSKRVQTILDRVSSSLVARAASFILLADTQASFAIEGERLQINSKQRWLKAVQDVGQTPLSVDELNRLQDLLLGDTRFSASGLRKDHVFIGKRTSSNEPLPEFIGARPEDLSQLLQGLIKANAIMSESGIDAIVQAAATAFGFVFIHPYEDGNGRLHRWLIHQVLAEREFSPKGLVFPVSTVMLKQIESYKSVLKNHSQPLMPFIEWQATNRGNVVVTNNTADLYRYFDATEAAEFLYGCVEETIKVDVPRELDYLKRHDRALNDITIAVEIPNRAAESFIMFMQQNNWKLPKGRRVDEFKELTDSEVAKLESLVQAAFNDF